MRKMKFLAPLLIVTTVMGYIACRKIDRVAEKEEAKQETDFFGTYKTTDESVLAVLSYMKRDEAKYHFVKEMVGRIGLPRWDRARVFVDGTGQIYGRSADGDSATIVFIPFVRPEDGFVNSLLSFRMTQSDTAWRGISDWQYDNLGYDTIPPDTSRFCARDAFNLIATMDQAVFGTTEFEITNGQIFGRDETDTLWATFNSPGGSGRAVGMQRSNFVSVSLICNTIEVCEPTTRGFRSASNGTNCYQAQQCTMI